MHILAKYFYSTFDKQWVLFHQNMHNKFISLIKYFAYYTLFKCKLQSRQICTFNKYEFLCREVFMKKQKILIR